MRQLRLTDPLTRSRSGDEMIGLGELIDLSESVMWILAGAVGIAAIILAVMWWAARTKLD